MKRSIKVLIIDDSALVRQTLKEIISLDQDLEVIGTAADPFFAAKKIKENIPDVITLDVEMPRMDGLTFLKTLMAQFPIPVVVISSLTQGRSQHALRALELGAVEIVAKSEIKNTKEHLEETRIRITDAIKAAHMVRVKRIAPGENTPAQVINVRKGPGTHQGFLLTTGRIVAIGASTGGTQALRFLLQKLTVDCPGILIVQHMPSGFTRSFAENLDSLCDITVKEAEDREFVLKGHAYVCPGGRHMTIERSGTKYMIRINDGELVNRHRPSVDVLFKSVSKTAGPNAVGVIMTGMGRDGADGLLQMRQMGATTIAQDEQSCVVFGMPGEAIKLQAADYILSLEGISERLFSLV